MHAGETRGRETPRIAGAPQIWNEPPFSPPSSPSQGINVSFEKQTRSFPSPNCHSRTNFLPILFFFLSRIDDEHALAFGIGRYRLYIYKERLKRWIRRIEGILEF